MLSGTFNVNGVAMQQRDGLGIWDTTSFSIKATAPNAEILLMEVPMVIG